MENRYVLFHVALVLNILILVFFTGVISTPVIQPSITEVMKDDTNLCRESKLLYESEYAKLCASLPYPTASLNFTEQNLDIFLCLGVYDTAYKICQYPRVLFNTTVLIPYLKKFISDATLIQEKEKKFCDNLQFTSSYNKIDSLFKPFIEELNKSYKCQKICFDLNDKLKPLCAVFAWIKKFDDIKKANRTETKHDIVTSDLVTSNETTSKWNSKVELKQTPEVTEVKEPNEQNANKLIAIPENNNVKKTNSNVPQTLPTVHAELDEEKILDSEKSNKDQKKLDNLKTTPHKSSSPMLDNKNIDKTETNVKIVKPTKTIPISSNADLQVSSMNNPVSNVPKEDVVNEEKGEEFKEQNDDLKTSTLSENTQDRYDPEEARNPEEDVETNIDSNIEGINVHKFIFT